MQTIVDKHPCQKVCKSAAIRSIGMIGSRSLPQPLAERVGNIVEDLLSRHYHIAQGVPLVLINLLLNDYFGLDVQILVPSIQLGKIMQGSQLKCVP